MSKLYDLLELIISKVNTTVRTTPQYYSNAEKLQIRENLGIVGSGKDGVSATHSWNGTTLTISSASGTSSANLKGDSHVYTLAEGETIEDVPECATVIVDPYTDPASVEMVATLDDGTNVTYQLFGEVVP